MDAPLEAGVRKIAVMKCAQTGGPLALDTPIPTPGGWTTMGALRPGDIVFDETGRPTAVTAVSDVMAGKACFAVTFSDGTSIVADDVHRWAVESAVAIAHGAPDLRRTRLGRPRAGEVAAYRGVVTTADLASTLKTPGGRSRYAIPLAGPLACADAELPLHPYVLGLWLGNGHSYAAQIIQHADDADVVMAELQACGLTPVRLPARPEAGRAVTIALDPVRDTYRHRTHCRRGHALVEAGRTPRGACRTCHRQQVAQSQTGRPRDPVIDAPDGIAARLARLGLLKGRLSTRHHQKHIPPQYLRASIAQRWALLQGLMDTDGTCSTKGRPSYFTTNAALRDGLLELLRSLGLKPTAAPRRGRVKVAAAKQYQCQDGWVIGFTAYRDHPVFRLARKQARLLDRATRRPAKALRRRIVAVDPVPSVPVRCITVAAASHLYLAGRAMVPTHNSEALHCILGFHMEYDPCPMLFVHPTAEVAQEWSKERLNDMLRTTPALAKVVHDKRGDRESNTAESTLGLKLFDGGFLAIGGANTPNTFARRAVRIAIGDDVDRFPAVVGDEGDPLDLLAGRTTTFFDPLLIAVSTPTLKNGRIDTLFQMSDQRRYHVECPECGHWDWITWSDGAHFRVVWDDENPHTAALQCPICAERLPEHVRRQMVADGEWRPTAEAKEEGLIGFQLPAMVSTLGLGLPDLVAQWLAARRKGKESLRVFINTRLAEGWEDRRERLDPTGLMKRREAYDPTHTGVEVPGRAVCLTCGVDVQDDRFELQVQAWGPALERWVVDVRVIPGDTKQADTHQALLDALSRRYTHASGHQLPILATCIDTGHNTHEIYSFVARYQARRIFATKGFAGKTGEPIVGKPSEKRSGAKDARPVRLYPVNVDDAKADVLAALSLPAPRPELGDTPQPGYMHLPLEVDTINDEFCAQLCAEHRETRYNRQRVATHQVWVQDRERNEGLDTAVLALAAFKLLNPNIRQYQERLATTPPPTARPAAAEASPAAPSPATTRQAPRSRFAPSAYLQRR